MQGTWQTFSATGGVERLSVRGAPVPVCAERLLEDLGSCPGVCRDPGAHEVVQHSRLRRAESSDRCGSPPPVEAGDVGYNVLRADRAVEDRLGGEPLLENQQ